MSNRLLLLVLAGLLTLGAGCAYASKDSWFQHVAIEVSGEGTSTEWLGFPEPDEYAKLK